MSREALLVSVKLDLKSLNLPLVSSRVFEFFKIANDMKVPREVAVFRIKHWDRRNS